MSTMATLAKAESKHMYSWWWDSHISPKNSKWLRENLTDTDSKVKDMIKLIEVDNDSFAKRADMYYKNRPELMKLLEELYKAYRALAERYDHATGVIRQAHRTMAEAFPNQVPSFESDPDSWTPEMLTPVKAARELVESRKVTSGGLSSSDFCLKDKNGRCIDESHSVTGKHSNDTSGSVEVPSVTKLADGKARKSLNFDNAGKEAASDSERLSGAENDIQALKETLAKLEAEKEAGLSQHQHSLQRLANLEMEVSRAQKDSEGLNERARNAEAEVQAFKDSLVKLECERETNYLQYQRCLEQVSSLESDISVAHEEAGRQEQRACEAEKGAQILKEELEQIKSEKEASLAKYMEALEKIASLEIKLSLAEDKALAMSDRAEKAQKEVEQIQQIVARLSQEKEALALRNTQCLEKIASLEEDITSANREAQRLKDERDLGAVNLKGAQEQCLQLERSSILMKTELDSLNHKLGMQNEEISGKHKELGRLWTCVQEERVRFVEADASFRSLQRLHSQTQDELRSTASELQKRVQLLKDMEIQNQILQDEVQKVKTDNRGLNEVNSSSVISAKNLEDEISSLKEHKGQLEGELRLRLDQTNTLKQEIYSLKDALKSLNEKHQAMMEQVQAVGFLPECLGSSVTNLQDENFNLKESCQKSKAEISTLMQKLDAMEELVEKNLLLEKSLSELGVELESARAKVESLEESCQLLLNEKSTIVAEKASLISQLTITTCNLDQLSERNTLLKTSLFDTNAELEALRAMSKNLEDSLQLLSDENSTLITEKRSLEMKLESAQGELEGLSRRKTELEQDYSGMKSERDSTLRMVDELRILLTSEKQKHSDLSQTNNCQIAKMDNRISLLEEASKTATVDLEGELDKAVAAQFEIFILRHSLQDMKDINIALLQKCERLVATSKLSEELVLELECENFEQHEEVNFLSDQMKRLRVGMIQLLKALEVDLDLGCSEEDLSEDQLILQRILVKLKDSRDSLCRAWEENQKLVIEKSVLVTLLGQLKQEVEDLKTLIITLQQEFRIGNDQLCFLQKDMQKLLINNEQLLSNVRTENHKESVLVAQVEHLGAKLLDMEGICLKLEKEKGRVLEDNKSLTKQVLSLDEEKHELELENSQLIVDALSLDSLTEIVRNSAKERLVAIDQLTTDIDMVCSNSYALEKKVKIMEDRLDKVQKEKMTLEVALKTCECELTEVTAANSQLKHQLSQSEMQLLAVEAEKDEQHEQVIEITRKHHESLIERELIQESINNLESEANRVSDKHEEAQRRIGTLCLEVQKGKDETKLWETVAGTFFTELQTTSVREALLKEKFAELSREYESLEDENHQLRAQCEAYAPALATLRDCVASLESHTLPSVSGHTSSYEKKDMDIAQGSSDAPNGLSSLENVAFKIKAIESSVIEMKKLYKDQHSQTSSKLTAGSKTPKLSWSRRSDNTRSGRHHHTETQDGEESRQNISYQQLSPPTPTYSTQSYGDNLMTKDIILDQASSGNSTHERNQKEYSDNNDDQILELWETIDRATSIDLRVGKSRQNKVGPTLSEINHRQQRQFDTVKELGRRVPSSESLVENELGDDNKPGVSKRSPEPLEPETRKRILERLASDVQKVTNLQITVHDLKHKVRTTENDFASKGNKDGVNTEYLTAKERLEQAERSIQKLLEANSKLVMTVESSPAETPYEGSPISPSSDVGTSSRRKGRVCEQARKCSEKLGRLQLEVQKIQFLLLKLDNGGSFQAAAARGSGTRVGEKNTKVLLREFLYVGGSKTPRRKKKSRFCGCVRPASSGGDVTP